MVGTDEFVELARLESRNRGLEGLPLAIVRHPLGGIGQDEVLQKVEGVVGDVMRALCIDATAPVAGSRP